MALRMGFKIIRFIHRNKFTNVGYIRTFSSQNTKLKVSNHPTKAIRTLSQQLLPQRKLTNKNVEQNPNSNQRESPSIDITKTPLIIPSELENEPVTIRRRFAKSSTQIALTQPLKLPRLANPFPDPIKTLPSDTVSDSEKARLAQEEVKMEARFHLQMQQEKLLEKNSYNMYQANNNNVQQPNQSEQYQQNNFQQFQQQSNQPKFRKPKKYTELQNEDRSITNECEMKQQKKLAVNSPENYAEEKKGKRPRGNRSRRKAHTRAARYLRHSWYPRHVRRQQREYSTSAAINPELMSEIEQCDILLRRLKASYPEYRNLEKPLLIPGSEEEKQFIKHILKLYAKHKTEPTNRNPAPIPSYSEVKTFKREFKRNNNLLDKDLTKNVTLDIGNGTRFYSTNSKDNINISTTRKSCPKFKLLGKAPVQRISAEKVILRKKKAPYPAYSELCDITLVDGPPENAFCPWKADVSNLLKTKTSKKYYSTSAHETTTVEIKKQAKKKGPCKNPFPKVPECDYVKQAEKRSERKRKKHCPKKQKPCGKKSASASTEDSGKIISKIKTWLSSYKPESSNIKVSRSAIDVDGRETYIIDVCECEEVQKEKPNYEFATEIVEIIQPPADIAPVQNPFVTTGPKRMPFKNVEYKPIELKDSHAPEMIQPLPVLTKNIPEFISYSATNLTHQKRPEELKITQAVPTKQPIPAKVKQLADKLEPVKLPAPVNKVAAKIDLKPVKLQTPDKIEMKPVPSRIPVKINKLEMKSVKKIPPKLEPDEAKTNVEIKPNEIVINKVKESLIAKPKDNSKINVVKSNFFKDNKKKDFKLLNVKNNISNPFKDFKVNDMTENSNEAYPLLSRSTSDDGCYKNPGCKGDLVGGCKKKKKEKQTKRRCRTPKKRKLPSCDDVKQKKKPKCAPFSIPGLEDKPEYYINAPKKTYFKKSDNISNFIDLKTEDIEVLANQKPQKKEDNEPFKLKPQFWKKHRNRI